MTKAGLTFEPPGPGPWDLDSMHFPRPVTEYWAEMHPEPFRRGFAYGAEFYGLPFETRTIAYVNGFCYSQEEPLAPDAFAERVERAAAVFEGKLWRELVTEWRDVRRPASERANRAVQAIDPDSLSDDELVAYLLRCRDNHADMIWQHMAFTSTATLTPGDFLAHASEWTGLPSVKLLALLRGASPISGGGSPQQVALAATYRADAVARAALDADEEPAALLERLRREPTATGQALNEFLEFVGYRLLDGFDISGRYALELPDVVLRSVKTAIDSDVADTDISADLAEVRALVPDEHRAEFDSLLEEARLGYSVRDERGVYGDVWAAGLMRRAALAAGRRLVARGQLHDVEHVVFASAADMCAMVNGATSPTADELAARHTFHQSNRAKDAPEHIGDDPAPPPVPGELPPPMQRLLAAFGSAMGEVFGSSEEAHEETVIRGLAASAGVREGIARRVADPADFDSIQQGDVLLTEATSEAFNILLPLLTAIITDSGGGLSHAAIVAREYGIPAVVGTRDATQRIANGARVLVDGDAGTVTVLG